FTEDANLVAVGKAASEVLVLVSELRADPDDDPRRQSVTGRGNLDDALLGAGLRDVGAVDPTEAPRWRGDHEPAARIVAMHCHLLAGVELERGIVALSRSTADDHAVTSDDRLIGKLGGSSDGCCGND